MELVNKNVENLQTLRDIVGSDQFNVILERLTGEHIYFNKRVVSPSKDERDAAIKKDYYHGIDMPELVDKYGLKLSSIYKIVESRQGNIH